MSLRSNAKALRRNGVLSAELAGLGAVRRPVDPAAVKLMQPQTGERAFNRTGWIFEVKYDGFRLLAAGGVGEARLRYRSGLDATRILPELAAAVASLPYHGLLLDGEVVTLDGQGRPDFHRLQRRALRTRAIDAGHAAAAAPATLFAFDLLACEGFDLRPLPLRARRSILRRVLPPDDGWIRYSEEIAEQGEELYAAVAELRLEGIVGKRAESTYRGGHSADWLKVRVDRSADFAVVGFDPGPCGGFRRLHLAVRDAGDGLIYAGAVGTGFTREDAGEIRAGLARLQTVSPRWEANGSKTALWVEPRLVVEVRYKEWSRGGHLRHPVFLRLRLDKSVDECRSPI